MRNDKKYFSLSIVTIEPFLFQSTAINRKEKGFIVFYHQKEVQTKI